MWSGIPLQGRRTMGNAAKSGTCMPGCRKHRTSQDHSHCYTNEIYWISIQPSLDMVQFSFRWWRPQKTEIRRVAC